MQDQDWNIRRQFVFFHLNFFETGASRRFHGSCQCYSTFITASFYSTLRGGVWGAYLQGEPGHGHVRAAETGHLYQARPHWGPTCWVLSETNRSPWSCITHADRNTQLTIGADGGTKQLQGQNREQDSSQHRPKRRLITTREPQANLTVTVYFVFTPLYEKQEWIYIFKRQRGKRGVSQ